MITTSIVVPSVIVILAVQVLKDLYGKTSARWGALIAQIALLAVSFAVAGIGAVLGTLPPEMYQSTLVVFTSGMVIYEVFYKAIYKGAIKGGKSE